MVNTDSIWQGIVEGLSRSKRGLTILEESGEIRYTPSELKAAAERSGVGLLRAGVMPGDRVGILAQTAPSTILGILGCFAAGAVAVPLPLPMRAVDPEAFIEQTVLRLDKVGAKLVVLPGELISMVGDMGERVRLLAAEELPADGDLPSPASGREDIAIVQFTSGSTSEPRGVVLTHGNVNANSRAIAATVGVHPEDTVVSWLPLYHDMGLIGFLITALNSGTSLVIMPSQRFTADPSLWLQAISDHKATLTGGPNFGFALASRVLRSGRAEGMDLSSLRLALNGAEPVDPAVLDGLIEAGEPYGLKPEVPYPVYGLAEATLAVTFPPPGRRYVIDHVSRTAVQEEDFAASSIPGEEDSQAFVSLGRPLPGVEVSIIRSDGRKADEREVGEVCIQAPSVMQGYWDDPGKTADALRGGWLHTGDLGYLAGGELYLVGRIKDMVIIGGRNLFPEDVERCAEQVDGVRKGNAIAFGVTSRKGRERLVLVGETRLKCTNRAQEAAQAVSSQVRESIGVPVREVVLVPAGSLPKTSSGKKRRFLCRDLYLEEQLQPVARSGATILKS
jgi:fatty-acyl-CoA synthase